MAQNSSVQSDGAEITEVTKSFTSIQDLLLKLEESLNVACQREAPYKMLMLDTKLMFLRVELGIENHHKASPILEGESKIPAEEFLTRCLQRLEHAYRICPDSDRWDLKRSFASSTSCLERMITKTERHKFEIWKVGGVVQKTRTLSPTGRPPASTSSQGESSSRQDRLEFFRRRELQHQAGAPAAARNPGQATTQPTPVRKDSVQYILNQEPSPPATAPDTPSTVRHSETPSVEQRVIHPAGSIPKLVSPAPSSSEAEQLPEEQSTGFTPVNAKRPEEKQPSPPSPQLFSRRRPSEEEEAAAEEAENDGAAEPGAKRRARDKHAMEMRWGERLNTSLGTQATSPCAKCRRSPERCRVAADPVAFNSFKCARCIGSKTACSLSIDNPGVAYPAHVIAAAREAEDRKRSSRRKANATAKERRAASAAAATEEGGPSRGGREGAEE